MIPNESQFPKEMTEKEYHEVMSQDPRYETPEAAEERVNAMWKAEQEKKKMYPNKPQMSEGDEMEKANASLLGLIPSKFVKPTKKQSAAKELYKKNIAEHAVRTATVQGLTKEYNEDPRAATEINAEAVGRARRGEPSKYRTAKDLKDK
jgi:hypothetical protein